VTILITTKILQLHITYTVDHLLQGIVLRCSPSILPLRVYILDTHTLDRC